MSNKINRSHLLVIVAVFCLIISGCLGGGNVSDLPDCMSLPGSSLDLSYWTDCQGTLTITNGDQYVGEFKNGMPNGKGTMTRLNGDKYVGEWKDGLPHVRGTMTFSNGDKYVGGFIDGKFHNQGTYTYANGDQDKGIWKENAFLYET